MTRFNLRWMCSRWRSRSRPRRRSNAPGYTAIEVLMALTLMAIGASAVMAMQKASVQGNLDARRADVANSIERLWVERLRRDAMLWTLPSPANPAGNNFTGTKFLNNVTGTWFLPNALVAAAVPISPAFDILGRDLADVSQARFCVHLRLTWLVQNVANPQDSLIRADVRVL